MFFCFDLLFRFHKCPICYHVLLVKRFWKSIYGYRKKWVHGLMYAFCSWNLFSIRWCWQHVPKRVCVLEDFFKIFTAYFYLLFTHDSSVVFLFNGILKNGNENVCDLKEMLKFKDHWIFIVTEFKLHESRCHFRLWSSIQRMLSFLYLVILI